MTGAIAGAGAPPGSCWWEEELPEAGPVPWDRPQPSPSGCSPSLALHPGQRPPQLRSLTSKGSQEWTQLTSSSSKSRDWSQGRSCWPRSRCRPSRDSWPPSAPSGRTSGPCLSAPVCPGSASHPRVLARVSLPPAAHPPGSTAQRRSSLWDLADIHHPAPTPGPGPRTGEPSGGATLLFGPQAQAPLGSGTRWQRLGWDRLCGGTAANISPGPALTWDWTPPTGRDSSNLLPSVDLGRRGSGPAWPDHMPRPPGRRGHRSSNVLPATPEPSASGPCR